MAVIVTNKSTAYAVLLNEGTDSSGNIITKSTAMPKIKNGANEDKVLAVVNAYVQIAEAPLYATRRTVVNILSE